MINGINNSWFESMTTKPIVCSNGSILGGGSYGSEDATSGTEEGCGCNYSIWWVLGALAVGYLIRGNK
jgi:hypothetical protein